MGVLDGRVCLITGASRGLGVHIARAFWEAGASLFLVARRIHPPDWPAAPGQHLHVAEADLCTPGAAAAVVRAARTEFSGLDVLVNNAAIHGPIGAVWENDWSEWTATLAVNLLAPVELCRLCVPWMRRSTEAPRGKIINLSGGGATSPRPHFSAYGTSKAALARFSETLAAEVAPLGIDVNALAPGTLATRMTQQTVALGVEAVSLREYEVALRATVEGEATFGPAVQLALLMASSASDGITGRLISAVWDRWEELPARAAELRDTDVFTLRRILPRDRGFSWDIA